jgi:hypothetical protein
MIIDDIHTPLKSVAGYSACFDGMDNKTYQLKQEYKLFFRLRTFLIPLIIEKVEKSVEVKYVTFSTFGVH